MHSRMPTGVSNPGYGHWDGAVQRNTIRGRVMTPVRRVRVLRTIRRVNPWGGCPSQFAYRVVSCRGLMRKMLASR